MTHPKEEDVELVELAERCEAAEGPDREIDLAIIEAIYPGAKPYPHSAELFIHAGGHFRLSDFRYTASLDAAMSLVPLSEDWEISAGPNDATAMILSCGSRSDAKTPALALCAAALRAKAKGGE
jgi:hypothetical protein